MSQSPPPYVDISGIYVQTDKHVDITRAEYNGNARPGQLVVDTADFALYVGNSDGNLNSVGGGSASTGNITFTGSTISNNNADGLLATAAHTYAASLNSDDYAQLYWSGDVNSPEFLPLSTGNLYSWAYVSASGFEIAHVNIAAGFNSTWSYEPVGVVRQPVISVDNLPDPPNYVGATAVVSDSLEPAAGNFGNVVANAGSYTTTVFCDGTNWLIG